MFPTLKLLRFAPLVLVLLGCDKVPQSEIDATRARIDEAITAGADRFAPGSLKDAQAAFASALAEVEKENKRLVRSYEEARNHLERAQEIAGRAKAEAEVSAAELRRTSEQVIHDARIALDEAGSSVSSAPSGKGALADLAAMRADLDVLKAAMQEAQDAFQEGDYLTAQSKAESVKARAGEISQDVARAKTRKKTT